MNIIGHWLAFHYICLFYHCTCAKYTLYYTQIAQWQHGSQIINVVVESERKKDNRLLHYFISNEMESIFRPSIQRTRVQVRCVRKEMIYLQDIFDTHDIRFKEYYLILSFLIEVLNILQKQPTVTFSSCIHTPVVVKERLKLIWRPNHLFNSSKS